MKVKLPTLYSFRRCPYAMRARMALHYAGVQCELREILLKNKPPSMLAISAKATVPVLQLPDGQVIDESLDIMRWALSHVTGVESETWFQADDAIVQSLLSANDDEFKLHLDRYKYPQRFESADVRMHFQQAGDFLCRLEQLLAQSEFLLADTVSLADVAIFPFVRQFAAVDGSAFDALPFVHVQRWLAGWLADKRFLAIMIKRPVWSLGDETVLLI